MGSEDALYFGLIPRLHRGIFAMNELPELDELVQVGFFNILEERDVQIRGYPVRFDLDLMILFSANPSTYNRSGKVIPQLKDRIGSLIQTHYPRERELGIQILQQEAGIRFDGDLPIQVPYFMSEIIEEITIQARRSKFVDHAREFSARFSLANYRTMIASAQHRAVVLGEPIAVPRISDLGHLYTSSLGKLEVDLMGSHQMSERQILDSLIALSIKQVFQQYIEEFGLDEIAQIFSKGMRVEVGDMLPSENYAERLKHVPPVWEKAFEVNASQHPAVRASCVEFVLAVCTASIESVAPLNMVRYTMKPSSPSLGGTSRSTLGGIVHTYQKFNPVEFPSPTQPPPDLVSGAFEHALAYGSQRELTEEELARAIRLDPSQIAGLGPSLETLRAILEERKRRILEKYEAKSVESKVANKYQKEAKQIHPPKAWQTDFQMAVKHEQIYLLEHLWYRANAIRDLPSRC